ncbi:MAG TPA: hypothetical protein ENG47_05815 [Candidatus Aerophobetes bacterium]|uniref:Uncharacterized protein n=1 Tax=Aerophobetes bacterium TaxID=2030807 RepID=A0A7V0N054_UNCAE|nr:hypothetical protein [Candidatus Aerophobetes bacterium]
MEQLRDENMLKRYLSTVSIILVLFGIFSMCQPFTFWLYHYGFAILGGGAALYIILSHLKS